MRRKVLTLLFGFTYRHPTIFSVTGKLIFGGKSEIWRDVASLLVPLEAKVLELGCGMNSAVERGVVVDYSLALIKAVPPRISRKRICTSVLALPFRERAFDFVLAIFPPGIAADHGFFHQKGFWEELERVLSPSAECIFLVYVSYKSLFWRFLARVIDPLPGDFWAKTGELARGFKISEQTRLDPWGNSLVFVRAVKLDR
ncbi:MAG: hypothetical protein BMS9Abin34_202 [Patescibacteria group bacterium]|nr:MAG: hypothetical protein BMS9Abin34_202 [Patescibacteria group bacterium]